MSLVNFMQCPQTELVGRIRNIGAKWPPDTLRSFHPSLARPVRAFRINVYGVDTCPSAFNLMTINQTHILK